MLKSTVLLVLLTLKGSGPPGVNFVNFDAMEPCLTRAAQLQAVLEKAGIQVLENRCVASFQRFAPHRHRAAKGGGRRPEKTYTYLVALSRTRAMVIAQPDMTRCEAERARLLKQDATRRLFCAVSEQRELCGTTGAEPAAPGKSPAGQTRKITR